MLSREDKTKCLAAKETFNNRYRISAAVLAPVMDRMVFAGGAFASILLEEKPRDIDIFILATEVTDYATIEAFIDANQWAIEAKKNNTRYPDINPRISSVWKVKSRDIDYEIIFTDYTTPEDVVNDFDYEHSKVWYHSGKMNLTHLTYKSIMDMKLVLADGKSHKEVRKQKFIDRGWKL